LKMLQIVVQNVQNVIYKNWEFVKSKTAPAAIFKKIEKSIYLRNFDEIWQDSGREKRKKLQYLGNL